MGFWYRSESYGAATSCKALTRADAIADAASIARRTALPATVYLMPRRERYATVRPDGTVETVHAFLD